MALKTSSFTIFVVAKPSSTTAAYAQLLAFYADGNFVKLQRHATTTDIAFQVINSSASNWLQSQPSWGWNGNWERIFASVDGTGAAKLGVYNNASSINAVTTGVLGAPPNIDYASSYIGTSPLNPGAEQAFVGKIAEIIVYNAQLSETTQQSVNSYLTARYGF